MARAGLETPNPGGGSQGSSPQHAAGSELSLCLDVNSPSNWGCIISLGNLFRGLIGLAVSRGCPIFRVYFLYMLQGGAVRRKR